MRLFAGLEVSEEVACSLGAFAVRLRPFARLRWSPVENLHITTKFIGEWPLERCEELYDRLPILRVAPMVTVAGTGFFPNDRYPKIFYARVTASPELAALAQETDAACQTLGIAAEKHPYRPHVTLARVPESVQLYSLRDQLAAGEAPVFGSFEPNAYSLYESREGRYLPLKQFPLQVQAVQPQ